MKSGGLIVLGFCAGFYLKTVSINTAPQISYIKENSSDYKFTSPILYRETNKAVYPEYKDLEKRINAYISSTTSAGNADQVSVYYNDLNSKMWTGIGENERYNPGSMLKVAVAIGYLRLAENDPTVLSKQLYYTKTIDPGQYYKPENQLNTGNYTIEQLINSMIINSDNEATIVLVQNDPKSYIAVQNELNLPKATDNPDAVDFMSAKQYSSIFRVLYNSTYLDKKISNSILNLLSQATFKQGLVAGVPSNIIVSHKFGEHTEETYSGVISSRELHDCGIVYFPEKPYFLCVMTKGKDFSKLEFVISDISKLVYDDVDNN